MASIGKMRDRVTIYEIAQGQPDGIGGYTTTRTPVATVWAFVDQQAGSRDQQQQASENKSPYQITMRAGSYTITGDNILEWDGIEMQIDSIKTDNVKRYTIVQAWGNQV